MKKLKSEEAITILKGMKVDIPVPKAAVMQTKRNVALDMAIDALKCSEIPNGSDSISRQAAIELVKDVCDAIMSGCESRYDPETEDEVYTDIREVDAILKCNKEVRIALRNMPSAQPVAKDINVPINDCISRQAAIDAVDESLTRVFVEHRDIAEKMINKIPSAQPERRWIPCSERMPKKNGFYLCTTKDYITILEFIEGNPHYHEEPSFVSDVLGKCNSYVVAWMPLPEPYAERRTDDR